MNLIFFGNADFGSKTLLSLIESDKHKVNAIVVSKTITKSRKKNKNMRSSNWFGCFSSIDGFRVS